MRNRFFNYMLAAGFCASIMVSCAEKENGEVLQTHEKEYVTLTFNAAPDATKTSVDDEGQTAKVSWEAGDQLLVVPCGYSDQSTDVTLAASDIDAADPSKASCRIEAVDGVFEYDALYPAAAFMEMAEDSRIVASVPHEQDGTFCSGHLAASRSAFSMSFTHDFKFSNLTNFIQFTLESTDYKKIVFKGNNNEVISGPIAITTDPILATDHVLGTPYPLDGYPALTDVTVDISSHEGSTYYIAFLPNDFTLGFTLSFFKEGSSYPDAEIFVSKSADFSAHSKIFNLGKIDGKIKETIPEGALRGKFSTSATTQAYISQGNLVYDVNNEEWLFWDSQWYDYPMKSGEVDQDRIALFCWGYDPEKSITPGYCGYLDTTHGTLTSEHDWGRAIDDKGTWHTPTRDEWEYIINEREMTYGKSRYTRITAASSSTFQVSGMNVAGLFLYPDDFNGPLVTEKEYTWNELRNAGIAFLPLNGIINNDQLKVDEVINTYSGAWEGYYWTATTDSSFDWRVAYVLQFIGVDTYHALAKLHGAAVRLIANCE